MLSLEKCKKILQAEGKDYTDEKVKALQEALYAWASIVTDFKAIENEKPEE